MGTVAADCHDDLTSPQFAAPAGKLLVVAMSAQPSAYFGLATKTIDFLKRQLQGSTSAAHVSDIIVVINSILELRPVMMRDCDGSQDLASDFLIGLIGDVYEPVIHRYSKPAADGEDKDDILVLCKAFRGLGLLAVQSASPEADFKMLLDEDNCQRICGMLSSAILGDCSSSKDPGVLDDASSALARINSVYPDAAKILVATAFQSTSVVPTVELIRRVVPILVYVGANDVPIVGTYIDRFSNLVGTLMGMLLNNLEASPPSFDSAAELVLGLLNAMFQFKAKFIRPDYRAVLPASLLSDESVEGCHNLPRLIKNKMLLEPSSGSQSSSLPDPEVTFFSICFFVMRQLVMRSTDIGVDQTTGHPRLKLSSDFQGSQTSVDETRYLVLVARTTRFSLRNLEPNCQLALGLSSHIFRLFHSIPNGEMSLAWDQITPESNASNEAHQVAQLSLAISEGLSPLSLASLVS